MVRTLFFLVAVGPFAVLALGYTGRFIPLGESLAVFRLPILIIACGLLPILRTTKLLWPGLILILTSLLSMAIYYVPQKIDDQNVYRLYQKNMSFRIQNIVPLKADILGNRKIDFVTLQEVTNRNLGLVSQLSTEFFSSHVCPFAGVGGTAVLSRWPHIAGTKKCYEKDGMSVMQVNTPNGPLWVMAVHLNWPYPYRQAPQTKRLFKAIEGMDGPKLIAGDFNMVPWSYTLKAFERASNTQTVRPILHSFTLPYVPMTIPIDHVLVPKGSNAKTERRAKKGSDHDGVVVEFNWP